MSGFSRRYADAVMVGNAIAASQASQDAALAAGTGGAAIGVQRSEAGSVARTLNFWVKKSVLKVAQFTDPTTDTAAQVGAGIAAAIAAAIAGGKALEFEPGAIYTSDREAVFLGSALRGLRYWGQGCTILRASGAGPVASLDSGGTLARCDDVEFSDFMLKGNALSTYGLDMRGMGRSRILRVRAVDVVTAGFRAQWSVLTRHELTVSDNRDVFTIAPAVGLHVTESVAGNYTAACEFHCVMEGPISNLGIDYESGGLGNIFTGTCEAIPRGFRQRATAADAVLHYMDFEGNAVYDLLIEGRGLEVVGGDCQSLTSDLNVTVAATASDTSFRGGYKRAITIAAGALGTTVNDLALSDNGALGIQGAGAWRGGGNVKVSTLRAITADIADQAGAVGSFVGTLTGCTTAPTGTIAYRRVGDVVTLSFPAINGASNSTAATITGMPAAIRPALERMAVGIITNGGADSLGAVYVAPSGVITLAADTNFVLAGAGLKGIQLCSISYIAAP